MRFIEKIAVVTGSGKGIGKAIAVGLAKEGATVVISDINEETCQETVEEILQFGGNAMGVKADISQFDEAQNLVNSALEAFGRVDLLVNNAGIVRDYKITEMTESDWDNVIDVCLKGSFLVAKAATPSMIEQKYGKIVNIASRAYLGNPGQVNYSSAKAGIVGMTKSLAKELGKHNINVNAVAPGLIETDAIRFHPKYEKIKELQKKDTPIQRIGQPEDVAKAVLFLLSEDSSYITGDVLHVTGGRYG